MPPRAVLIGLPGVGKSSVGVRLAARLSVAFADSDQLIEQQQGRRISEIFERDGEAAFRRLETATIVQALGEFDGVLALGGGAVTTAEVRQALGRSGLPVVWLTADRAELVRRIGHTRHRPLLTGDPAARLAQLEHDREAFYRDVCTVVVDTAGLSLRAVTEQVAERIAA